MAHKIYSSDFYLAILSGFFILGCASQSANEKNIYLRYSQKNQNEAHYFLDGEEIEPVSESAEALHTEKKSSQNILAFSFPKNFKKEKNQYCTFTVAVAGYGKKDFLLNLESKRASSPKAFDLMLTIRENKTLDIYLNIPYGSNESNLTTLNFGGEKKVAHVE